jgi:glucosamine-6-phosphate deaminase
VIQRSEGSREIRSLRSSEIIVVVPDERKAQAVKFPVAGGITPQVPASILRTHANATLYLDKNSALLSAGSRSSA